jgi:hypothetical protein
VAKTGTVGDSTNVVPSLSAHPPAGPLPSEVPKKASIQVDFRSVGSGAVVGGLAIGSFAAREAQYARHKLPGPVQAGIVLGGVAAGAIVGASLIGLVGSAIVAPLQQKHALKPGAVTKRSQERQADAINGIANTSLVAGLGAALGGCYFLRIPPNSAAHVAKVMLATGAITGSMKLIGMGMTVPVVKAE